MRLVKAALATSLLFLTACTQQEMKALTGIIQLNCINYGLGDMIHANDLIIDLEKGRLLTYDIESDSLMERTVEVDNAFKDMETTWTMKREEDIITITAKSVFPKKFLDNRARKRAAWRRAGRTSFESFDALTATRQKEQIFQRFKINIKSLSANMLKKEELASKNSPTFESAKGFCIVREPPTQLVSSNQ